MISICELVAVLVVPIELVLEIHHGSASCFFTCGMVAATSASWSGSRISDTATWGATVLLIQDLAGQRQLQSADEVMRMVAAEKSIVDLHLLGTLEDAAADHRAVRY